MQRSLVIIALLTLFLSFTLQHANNAHTNNSNEDDKEELQGVKKFEETLAKSVDLLKKTLETKNITNFSFSLDLSDLSAPSQPPLPLPSLSPVDLSSPKEKLLRDLSRVDYLLLFLSSPWCAECKEKREEIERWVREQKGLRKVSAPPEEDTAKAEEGMEWLEGGSIMISEVSMEEILQWEEMKDLFAPFHSPPPSFRLLRRIPPSTQSLHQRHQCRASMVRETVEEYMQECGTFLRSLSSSPLSLHPSLLPSFSARSFLTLYLSLNPGTQEIKNGVIEMWKRRMSEIGYDSSLLQLALISPAVTHTLEGEEWRGGEGAVLLQLGAPSKRFDLALKSPKEIEERIKEIENELLARLQSPPARRGLSHHLLQLPLPPFPLHFRPPLPNADRFCILLLPDHSPSLHFPLLHSFHVVASQFPSFRFLYFTSGHKGLAERLNIEEMPAMVIIEQNKKYEYKGEWNEDEMGEYCLKHQMNLSSPPSLRSSPSSPSSSPISDLTADLIVPFLNARRHSNVLVFFYSPACYFCKSVRSTLLNEFEKRIREAGVEGNALEIAAYNTFENDLPPFLLLSRKPNESPLTPHLVLFAASDDTPRTTFLYNSPFSFNHLLNFILTKAQITDSEQLAKLQALQA